jgi:hypothetical protein
MADTDNMPVIGVAHERCCDAELAGTSSHDGTFARAASRTVMDSLLIRWRFVAATSGRFST